MGQENSDLNNIPDDYDTSSFNGFYCFNYGEGDIYRRKKYYGEWKDGKRHGQGTLEWSTGNIYKGNWVDDNICGIGSLDMVHSIYEGEFENNKFHGSGVLFCRKTNEKYEGQWKNHKYHGFGSFNYENGDSKERISYFGFWENGKRNGYGIMKWLDGTVYEGNWVYGRKEGKGKEINKKGNIYIGDFNNNLRHGKGIKSTANGDKYFGTWKNGKMNGVFEEIKSYGRIDNKVYIKGEEIENQAKQEVQSLQIYCIETIAKNRKQYNKLESINLPDHITNPIHLCKKSQKSLLSRIISEIVT